MTTHKQSLHPQTIENHVKYAHREHMKLEAELTQLKREFEQERSHKEPDAGKLKFLHSAIDSVDRAIEALMDIESYVNHRLKHGLSTTHKRFRPKQHHK